jgi:hypothetical protein
LQCGYILVSSRASKSAVINFLNSNLERKSIKTHKNNFTNQGDERDQLYIAANR